MKESMYNIKIHLKGKRYAIYNTFTQSCVITDDAIDYSNVTLQKLGIVIPDDVDELNIIKHDLIRSNCYPERSFRILTTTGCNAHCPYCYESGIAYSTMDDKTADQTILFIENHSFRDHKIFLEWFGGEPLLNHHVISKISEKLFDDGYTNINAAITTNGFLFDEKMVLRAVRNWRISNAQFTLDGVKHIHDDVKGIPGLFDRVINAINHLSSLGVNISVRMNVNGQNYHNVLDLITVLGNHITINDKIYIYAQPIFENKKFMSKEDMKIILKINEALFEHGLRSGKMYNYMYHSAGCAHSTLRGYTIAPDGKLYNCSHTVKTGKSVGTIWEYSDYNSERLKFVQLEIDTGCKSCKYLPICGGGCRVGALKLDNVSQCFQFYSVFEETIKQSIKNGWEL